MTIDWSIREFLEITCHITSTVKLYYFKSTCNDLHISQSRANVKLWWRSEKLFLVVHISELYIDEFIEFHWNVFYFLGIGRCSYFRITESKSACLSRKGFTKGNKRISRHIGRAKRTGSILNFQKQLLEPHLRTGLLQKLSSPLQAL